MAQVFKRPITAEQRKAAEERRAAAAEEERKIEQDLITAFLLEKISELEAKQDDSN